MQVPHREPLGQYQPAEPPDGLHVNMVVGYRNDRSARLLDRAGYVQSVIAPAFVVLVDVDDRDIVAAAGCLPFIDGLRGYTIDMEAEIFQQTLHHLSNAGEGLNHKSGLHLPVYEL